MHAFYIFFDYNFHCTHRVTGSHDKSIRIWNTSTWECIAVIGHAHKGQANITTTMYLSI